MLKNGMLLETRVSYNNIGIFPPKVLCPRRATTFPSCAVLLRIYNRTWYKISMYKRERLEAVPDEGEKGNRPYWKWTVTPDINTYPRVPLRSLYFSRLVIVLLRILQDEKKGTCSWIVSPRGRRGEKMVIGCIKNGSWLSTSAPFFPLHFARPYTFPPLFIVLRRIYISG